ncbi:MAG: alpha/beta fold hydrolase [Acidobacteriota bacterium]
MTRTIKWLRRGVFSTALVSGTVVLLRAFDSRRLPDLRAWHRFAPASEVSARELTADFTLADYLRREETTFAEVRREFEGRLRPEDRTRANRYFEESPLHPSHFPTNWNRTFELAPERIRGGVLLIHGLTDSPYSMRRLARIFQQSGFYALCPRMPGHGTVPGALAGISWEAWAAAVRMGARHVRSRIGSGQPFHVVGYSSGGALTLRYALDALADPALPRPDRLLILSPMIGVTRLAGLGKAAGVPGAVPFFEKSRWTDVLPEYNPFKYNSFPVNAGYQTFRLTRSVERDLEKAAASGEIRRLAPVLAFQSLVDSTVSTAAVVHTLFDRLPAGGSELVLFDRNRDATLSTLQPEGSEEALPRLLPRRSRRFAFTVVTNASPDTAEVVARRTGAGETEPETEALGLTWPPQTFSLSHIALPFAPDDPLYGSRPDPGEFYGVRLGTLAPRGERSGLIVPMEQLMRLTCNPFFPWVERRIREWIGGTAQQT